MLRRTVALAGLLAAGCAGSRPALPTSPLLGKTVEVVAPTLEGVEVQVHARGGKVRVVDFWASWCDPCREQLPFLDRLARTYEADGLFVYAISFDEDRTALERFLEEAPVSFPVLWDKGGAALSERLDVTRLPTTLLIDREGVVREVHLGFAPGEERKVEDAVRRLLAEPPVTREASVARRAPADR
jgi:cytochrome c biogenesis protein CcmG, thiol:disulfide interchange protein DsbE